MWTVPFFYGGANNPHDLLKSQYLNRCMQDGAVEKGIDFNVTRNAFIKKT
jgi:hypothetical protein